MSLTHMKHKSHNEKIASLSDLMYQRQYTEFTIVAYTVVLWSMNNFVMKTRLIYCDFTYQYHICSRMS